MPKKVILALFLMVGISLIEGVSLVLLIPLLQLVGLDVGQGSLGQIAGDSFCFFRYFRIATKFVNGFGNIRGGDQF